MAIIKDGLLTTLLKIDLGRSARVNIVGPHVDATTGGRYRATAQSGLATLLNAFTTTAGHFCAFRNPSTTKTCVVDYIKVAACMTTDFTNACELRLAARVARAFTALHTSGAATTLTTNNAKMRTSYQTCAAQLYVCTTGDLTAGTHVLDVAPFLVVPSKQADSGVTIQNPTIEGVFDAGAQGGPLILAQDEGIVFSNEILMSAVGVAHLSVTIGWREMLNAEVPAN